MKLSRELIYEAAIDDQLLADLPGLLAAAIGARSCTIHWRGDRGAKEIFSHSGHFTDVHFQIYMDGFADADPWSAVGLGATNRVFRCSDAVADEVYASSAFYNDWIRGIGDDTFRCMGAAMQTSSGVGLIGLHRGRTQQDFSDAEIAEIASYAADLRRMFAVRARIADADAEVATLAAIFDNTPYAAFLAEADGRLVYANRLGESLLRKGDVLHLIQGRLRARHRADPQLGEALAQTVSAVGPPPGGSVLHGKSGKAFFASFLPIRTEGYPARVLVTTGSPDRNADADGIDARLRRAFGLTPAEAEIARWLSEGYSLEAISHHRAASIGTVRNQIKSVMAKLDVRRQSDVVRVVSGIRP